MPAEPNPAQDSPWYKRPEYLLILCIATLYIVLIGRYRAYDLDDVWFLSFSHSDWVQHIDTDTLMLQVFPLGMGGVVAFGKLAAILQGSLLGLLGWSLFAATLLSVTLVVAALVLLADMCRQLGYTSNFTTCFIALVGLTEPFLAAAEKTRYEFLSVFLLALALWLAARRHLAWAIFVATLAVEVEPIAVVVPCAVVVTILVQNRHSIPLKSLLPRLALPAAAAAAIYLMLHPHIVSLFQHAEWHNVSAAAFPGGFVTAYFFIHKRHLPELLLLTVALAVSSSRTKRVLLLDWPALTGLTVLLVSTALRWSNTAYFGLMSPFLFLFILQVLYTERLSKLLLAAVLLYTFPQSAYRFYFWSSRDAGFSQHDQSQVRAAIDHAASILGEPPAQLNIIGNFNLWYAHPDNFVALQKNIATETMLTHADLVLCFDRTLDPILSPEENLEIPCSALRSVPSTLIDTINLRGHTLQVLAPHHHP